MKKRILCLALALCLVASLLPVTTLAAGVEPNIVIATGTGDASLGATFYKSFTAYQNYTTYLVTDENGDVTGGPYFNELPEDGKWNIRIKMKGDQMEITLKDAFIENTRTNGTYSHGLIVGTGDYALTLKLEGTNKIYSSKGYALHLQAKKGVTISGTGSLECISGSNSSSYAGTLKVYSDLLIQDATITLLQNATSYKCHCIYSTAGNITIDNANVTLKPKYGNGIWMNVDRVNNDDASVTGRTLEIRNGSNVLIDLYVSSSSSYQGIAMGDGNAFIIEDSTVEIYAKGYVFRKAPELKGNYVAYGSSVHKTSLTDADRLTPYTMEKDTKPASGELRYFKVEPVKAPPAFDKVQVIAGNDLTLNFRISQAEVDAAGGTQVKIERTGAAASEFVALTADMVNADGYYVIPYTGIAAKEMGDEIAMTVCNAEGEAVSVTRQDSVLQYALRMMEKDTLEGHSATQLAKLKTLLVDMLTYGAMAQELFGYNTDNSVLDALTEEQKQLGTQQMATCTNAKATVTPEEGFAADVYQGTSFILNYKIDMAVRMAAEMGEGSYASVTFTNYLGQKLDAKTVNATALSDGTFAYSYDGLVAADGRCLVEWTFYKADGTKVATVVDSMEQYVGRNAVTLPYLAQLINYSDAAKAYFTAV